MRSVRLPILFAALCLALTATDTFASESAPAGDAPPAPTPRAVVESLHAVLRDCMQGACGADFEARYAYLFERLGDFFDLPFMARVTIARKWGSLSVEERAAFVDLSHRLSASNYAANFKSFDDQRFETLGEEPAGRGTVLVKTEFVQPNDDDVRFDYRLRETSVGWRIIDVTLDGAVSEITLRRSEYASVIRREGFPELVDALEKKIEKLAAK